MVGVCKECDSKGDSGLLQWAFGSKRAGTRVFYKRVNKPFGLLGFARILFLEE